MRTYEEKIEKLYCLAQDRHHENNLQAAIDALKALLAINFSHKDAHTLIALWYQEDQSYELSLQHFRKALELEPKNISHLKSMAFNYKQLALDKNAIFILQKYLHKKSDDAEAYEMLGDIYSRRGEWHYALKVYQDAIKLDPKTPGYYFKKAKALHALDQYEKAFTELKKALLLDQKNRAMLSFGIHLTDILHKTQEKETLQHTLDTMAHRQL